MSITVASHLDDFGHPQSSANLHSQIPPSVDAAKTPEGKAAIAKAGQYLILPSGDMTFTEAARAIYTKIGAAKTLYYRGGQIHRVHTDGRGIKVLKTVTPVEFRSIIEGFGPVFAWRAGCSGPMLKPSRCSDDQARALMACIEARELLPNVNVISPCPILAKGDDDSIKLLGPGWHDHQGGTFVTGTVMPEKVPLDKALPALKQLVVDFKFVTPGDRARALASFLTPALKLGGWLRKLTPIDIGEADKSQGGKTYRQEMVAAIYGLTPYVTGNSTGGVGSLDESLKSAIRAGHTFILIDNVRGCLNSQFLERVLTTPECVPCRVPYHGEVECDATNQMFQLTSNLAEMTRDLANRSTIVRIIKQHDGYKFHKFDDGLDAKAHVQAQQGYYLGCVFALIKEWCASGNPRHDIRTGNAFAEWASVLDWFTKNLFNAGELMDGMNAAADRVCDPKQNWIRTIGAVVKQCGRFNEQLKAIDLATLAMDSEALPPGVKDDAEDLVVARKIGSIFGCLFSVSNNTLTIEGLTVARETRHDSDKGRDEKLYRFSAADAEGGQMTISAA